MPFDKIEPIVPTDLIGFRVLLYKELSKEPGDPGQSQIVQGAKFEARVLLSNRDTGTVQGNLVPHLTQAERDWLLDLINRLEARARQELLSP